MLNAGYASLRVKCPNVDIQKIASILRGKVSVNIESTGILRIHQDQYPEIREDVVYVSEARIYRCKPTGDHLIKFALSLPNLLSVLVQSIAVCCLLAILEGKCQVNSRTSDEQS